MALITISGYPCSGKSRRAAQIKAHLEATLQQPNYIGPSLKVVLLSDDVLNIGRSAYNGELRCFYRFRCCLTTLNRQPVGKASAWSTLHRDAAPDGPRHHPDRRRAELHQGFSISDVLCGEGDEVACLHCAYISSLQGCCKEFPCDSSRCMSSQRTSCVGSGTRLGKMGGRMSLKRAFRFIVFTNSGRLMLRG